MLLYIDLGHRIKMRLVPDRIQQLKKLSQQSAVSERCHPFNAVVFPTLSS
jgi:hypothetical protein